MSVILIGYRGSGKSSVGRILAQRLGWSFVDADDSIVQQAGMTIKDIFARHGEEYFRDLESGVVKTLCGKPDHVIALGGGAVLRDQNRAAIKTSGAKVIYLHADPDTLLDRIRADPQTSASRPNLTALGGGIQEVRTLLAKRLPLYREVKTHEINVTHLTPEQVVARVMALLSKT